MESSFWMRSCLTGCTRSLIISLVLHSMSYHNSSKVGYSTARPNLSPAFSFCSAHCLCLSSALVSLRPSAVSTLSFRGVLSPFCCLLGGAFLGLVGSPFLMLFFGYAFGVSEVGVSSRLAEALVSIGAGFFLSFSYFLFCGLFSCPSSDSSPDWLELPSSESTSSLLGYLDDMITSRFLKKSITDKNPIISK